MRRLASLFIPLVVAQFALGAVRESDPQPRAVAARQGRPMIVEPARPFTDADRTALAREGVYIKHALAGGRYLARVANTAKVDDARITSVRPFSVSEKITRSARAEVARGAAQSELNVVFQRDIDFDDARNAILQAGGTLADPLTVRFSPAYRLRAFVPTQALTALAGDDRVFAVSGPVRWKVRSDNNADTARISHVTELYDAPYGLTGQGVRVSLFELAAAQADHVEFGGRLTVHAVGGSGGDKDHATHTSGTIGAAGVNPKAKGMAPNVLIDEFCVAVPGGNDCTNDWLDTKENDLAPIGVLSDNNSWGYVLGWSTDSGTPVWNDADVYYGAYDLDVTAPVDKISIEKHILFIHSAGNDGSDPRQVNEDLGQHRHVDANGDTDTTKLYCFADKLAQGASCPTSTCTGGCEATRHHPLTPFDTIGVTASAKNIITVGSTLADFTDPNNPKPGVIASYSSRGPAKDGRIKPDVVERGSGVLSTVPTNDYRTMSGTSMAAPAVTGIAALLTEQWRRTFAGANPLPEQLKAIIIAGAQDLGNPGPDYTYGFGFVNAKASADIIIADAGQGNRIRTVTVGQGQTAEKTFDVTAAQNLRFVLNWADPYLPGVEIGEKALVNDLDLTVVGPDGVTHHAYVLDKNNPDAYATTGTNTVDNVEMVEIANAAPGTYTAVVTGTTVTQPPQSAILVSSVSASTTPPPPPPPPPVFGKSRAVRH